MPALIPTALKREGDDKLVIEWSDGQRRVYRWSQLREACPCAGCREQRSRPHSESLLPILSPEQAQPPRPTAMKPVGRYAYQIHWNDGHSSGIYTFDYLRNLGEAAEGPPPAD